MHGRDRLPGRTSALVRPGALDQGATTNWSRSTMSAHAAQTIRNKRYPRRSPGRGRLSRRRPSARRHGCYGWDTHRYRHSRGTCGDLCGVPSPPNSSAIQAFPRGAALLDNGIARWLHRATVQRHGLSPFPLTGDDDISSGKPSGLMSTTAMPPFFLASSAACNKPSSIRLRGHRGFGRWCFSQSVAA
jgi:hypothetical protein